MQTGSAPTPAPQTIDLAALNTQGGVRWAPPETDEERRHRLAYATRSHINAIAAGWLGGIALALLASSAAWAGFNAEAESTRAAAWAAVSAAFAAVPAFFAGRWSVKADGKD